MAEKVEGEQKFSGESRHSKIKKIGKKIRGTMHEEKKDVVIMLDFSINDHK